MPDCLICGRETSALHLGMDACRACTVFFRRHRGGRDKLQCINSTGHCTDYRNGASACRKCRLERFESVMAAGRTGETNLTMETTIPSPSTSSDSPVEVPDGVSLNMNFNKMMEITSTSIYTAPSTPTHSIIDKIRSSHRTLCLMRRSAEFQMRGICMDPFEADREQYAIVPSTYKIMNEGIRILISGLIEFIPAIFPEFADLPVADKWLLIRNYQQVFIILDSSLRSQRRCGDQNEILFGSYTTFLSPDTVEIYFSDCPDQKNVAEAARTLRDCIQKNCIDEKRKLFRAQFTDDEYLALLGLVFWSVENTVLNERLLELASRYRTEILSDLNNKHRQTIGGEEGAIRVGEMYSLLFGLKEQTELELKWEYEIYRMLNVFDDNTHMYQLQLHRPDVADNES